jgi:hypothetical protein
LRRVIAKGRRWRWKLEEGEEGELLGERIMLEVVWWWSRFRGRNK